MFDEEKKPSPFTRLRAAKVPLWLLLVPVGALALTLAAQPLLARKSERERDAAVQEAVTRAAANAIYARRRAETELARVTEETYRLFGKAFAWALRGAWLRHDSAELDRFVAELVADDRIRLVVLADRKGRIVSASDLDMKGAQLSQRFPDAGLGGASVSIERTDARMRRLVIPVFGIRASLGTAVIVYETPTLGND